MAKKTKVGRKAAEISGTGFAARVAQRIREARAKSGRGVDDLAEAAGMSRITWYRFESETEGALAEFGSKIDAIAAALGVSLESLVKPLKEVKENHEPVSVKPPGGGKGKNPNGGRGVSLGHGAKSRTSGKAGV